MNNRRSIVQLITRGQGPDKPEQLVALACDGTAWNFVLGFGWKQIPPLPNPVKK